MHTQSAPLTDETTGLSECLDRLAALKQRRRPVSTYRLQFNRGFRFTDARNLVSYLDQLGISTCYASPILKARQGSMHGYDIVDHNSLNPEIGTQEELDELGAALRDRGMGLLLDVVPNHMGMGYGDNPWWQDVLQNGRSSRFASFFDIDWSPLKGELRNKVLLPILGDQYGEELESGKLKLVNESGNLRMEYYDKVLPIDPQTIPLIFEPLEEFNARADDEAVREFMGVLVGFSKLPPHDAADADRALGRQRDIPFLVQRMKDLLERKPALKDLVDAAIEQINGRVGDARSFDRLHRLLEAQAYRLAHWRVSAEEINYRRFFDINDLVGLRMEDPQVFAATQALIRRLLASGDVTSLRIDHPDGLFNPPQYFTRLQMLYAASQCCGAEPKQPQAENGIELELQSAYAQQEPKRAPLYAVVEKILAPGEELPKDWPVDGTVGYDFVNQVNGIFIETRNRKAFTNFYQRFLNQWMDVDTIIYQSKKLIMHSALSSELNVLTHMLDEISSMDRRARDFTRYALREAIREAMACFPVYRTYIDERGTISERDRGFINEAIARAKRRNGSMPGMIFEFLRDILLLRGGGNGGSPIHDYGKQLYFALKFQQLSGPVMAKGLEDTASYVYNRFVSMNEVGGSLKEFGVELDEFHRANLERLQHWPYSMLATSTHDTKRSEDVRMRLDVLSEMPRTWAAQVLRWRRSNRTTKKRTLSDGRTVPDPNEEYLLYQTLVGAWPLPLPQPRNMPSPAAETAAAQTGSGEHNGDRPAEATRSAAAPATSMSWSLTDEQRAEFIVRIQNYMTKAVNEAKVNLSWVNPNQEYTETLRDFIERTLTPGTESRPNRFLLHFEAFIPRVALFGAMNSLAQTLIKLTSPGIPDIYQGQELFDFSLVDPDNRRPVDFELRQRFLRDLMERSAEEQSLTELCAELLKNWTDGRLKLWVTRCALGARRQNRELFERGSYLPLRATEQNERRVVAYARMLEGAMAVIAAPRFTYTLMNGEERLPLGEAWGNTELVLPPEAANTVMRNGLTGELLRVSATHTLLCRELFASFPGALLLAI